MTKIVTKKDLVSIRGALRTAFIRSEYKKEFLKSIEILVYKVKNDGTKYKRPTRYFDCADCGQRYLIKDCKVDHILPIGQLFVYGHISGFIDRLWCEYGNLQGLCDDCHKRKTAYERGLIKGYAKL